MKTATKILVFVVTAAAAAGIVTVVQYRNAQHEAELDKVKHEVHEPGIVRFNPCEPQLGAIRAEIVSA